MSDNRRSPADSKRVAIIGGGAAGFFAALTCAEGDPDSKIHVFEKSRQFLSKVRISGGGRCNVTHSCFEPRQLVSSYPRGYRELLGAFHTWQPKDMIEWLNDHGVRVKTEQDGRMFPVTDSASTIIDCFLAAARKHGIALHLSTGIKTVSAKENTGFVLETATGASLDFEHLVIATGGGQATDSHALARQLGHTITELAPSLFTFKIADKRIQNLEGLSVENARVSCPAAKLDSEGPLLVTHWGLSGPAILKLSARGAREFAARDYTLELRINWLGASNREQCLRTLEKAKGDASRKSLSGHCPFALPRRLWQALLSASGAIADSQWSHIGKKTMGTLADQLTQGIFHANGKSMNKEEFVTCGGVTLSEIDFKRMESKRVPHLHFAGEALDIDGVTGGFNFQSAWTTARIAGNAIANARGD